MASLPPPPLEFPTAEDVRLARELANQKAIPRQLYQNLTALWAFRFNEAIRAYSRMGTDPEETE